MADYFAQFEGGGAEPPKPDEEEFRKWYAGVSKKLNIDPDPDSPEHHYDYRRFYKDVKAGTAQAPDTEGGHFTSEYKLPGHPREFLADSKGNTFNTVTGKYAKSGKAVSDKELDKAGNAPDLPAGPFAGTYQHPNEKPEAPESLKAPDYFAQFEGPSAETPRAQGKLTLDQKANAILEGLGGDMEVAKTGRIPTASETSALIHGAGQGLPFVGPYSDEITAGVRAGVDKITNPSINLGDAYRTHRQEERDHNKQLASDHPGLFYGADLATGLVGGAPKGALGAVAQGANVGLGTGEADLTQGEFKEAAKETGTGAAAGLAGHVVAGLVGKAADKIKRLVGPAGTAVRSAEHEVIHDLTDGATPTHQRRAFGDPASRKMAIDELERNKPLADAVKAHDGPEVVAATQQTLDATTPQTLPIYKKFDEVAGTIPVTGPSSYDDFLKSKIAKLGKSNDIQDKKIAEGIEHYRQERLATAAARKTDNWTFKDIRESVTGLLKQKQNTMGSIAETPTFLYRDELHQIGDDFLKSRMKVAAMLHPELEPDLAKITELNKTIATNLKIQDVVENADNREYWARKPLSEKASNLTKRLIAGAERGAVAGGVLSGGTGAAAGAAVGLGAGLVLPPAIAAGTKASETALAKLVGGVRAGAAGAELAQLVTDARDAGVPAAAVATALQASRNRPPTNQ